MVSIALSGGTVLSCSVVEARLSAKSALRQARVTRRSAQRGVPQGIIASWRLMTFSIVACDLEEQAWGVAVASKFPAVGAVVPWVQAEAGAVATQSFANTSYGTRGLALMGAGFSAQETLERLLEDDPDKELRQVGLVDAKGGSATFSGSECFAWAGGLSGKGYAIQGNILANDQVTPAMEKAIPEYDWEPTNPASYSPTGW